jgi:acetylornithine deacetylase/succinyl-diaminopimelate desuccinylase-like protein
MRRTCACLWLALLSGVLHAAPQRQMDPLLSDYFRFLSLPNTASDAVAIRRNADLLVQMMEERGLKPRLLEVAGSPPAVYGEWKVRGAKRTLVFYAHYDGQPADAKQWKSGDPWVAHLRDGRHDKGGKVIPVPERGAPIDPDWRVYGRSASDDKAGVMAILGAVSALRAAGVTPGVNLKFFFEGEEEAGSPHLKSMLETHRELLASDAWLICDGPVHPSGRKQVVFGVRGDVNVDLTVYGPLRPLHSGHYGNWVPNPGQTLISLLASMKDADGKVLIDGWYDDVTPLTAADRAAMAALPDDDARLLGELGLAAPEAGRRLAEAISLPSLNLNGVRAGDVLAAARNVIPTEAHATLDLRVVKGVSYLKQVERVRAHAAKQGFLVLDRVPTAEERAQHPRIVRISAESGGYDAERTAMDTPLARAVLAAVQSTTAQPVVAPPTAGGSLPLSIIRATLGASSISVPIANHDNNQHAEDENLRLGNLFDGVETMTALMKMKGW